MIVFKNTYVFEIEQTYVLYFLTIWKQEEPGCGQSITFKSFSITGENHNLVSFRCFHLRKLFLGLGKMEVIVSPLNTIKRKYGFINLKIVDSIMMLSISLRLTIDQFLLIDSSKYHQSQYWIKISIVFFSFCSISMWFAHWLFNVYFSKIFRERR